MDNYRKALDIDKDIAEEYYKKSLDKTQQQIFIEKLINNEIDDFLKAKKIGDIACGGGTLSYHLSYINNTSKYYLIDYNENAISLARQINKGPLFNIEVGNIYNLNFENNFFDYTFCWMSFLMFDNPELALSELIRVTKKGGKIFLSSLFNINHDVDIFCKFIDYTRESSSDDLLLNYNTYSRYTIAKWLEKKVDSFTIHKFEPDIDITYEGKGVGTYTKKCNDERLQISGGMLLNWGILEILV